MNDSFYLIGYFIFGYAIAKLYDYIKLEIKTKQIEAKDIERRYKEYESGNICKSFKGRN